MTSENILIGESIGNAVEDKVPSQQQQHPDSELVQSPTDDQEILNPAKLDTNQINFDHAECLPLLIDRHDLHFNHFPGTNHFLCVCFIHVC